MEHLVSGPAFWMLASGLLVARIVIGTLMIAHSGQKLFGWLGGGGLRGTAGFFEALGFYPGREFAAAAAVIELLSGTLVVLGLFGPVGPALMISIMLVAAVSVHRGHGLFAATNGIEVPLLYGTAALALALAGFGPWSLDALLRLQWQWTPTFTFVVVAGGVLIGLGNLAIRRRRLSAALGRTRPRAS